MPRCRNQRRSDRHRPVVSRGSGVADETLLFTEIGAGRISRWVPDGEVSTFAMPGGGPNGATLAADGSLLVTQNGGTLDGSRRPPGIVRVMPDGAVTTIATELAGFALGAPQRSRLRRRWALVVHRPQRSRHPRRNDNPGRIFALDPTSGVGELIIELGPVYPNGIGFLADGTMVWTESFSRRVMALRGGRAQVITELPERHFPDGFCVSADGRLYVASTFAHCCTGVADGEHRRPLHVCGRHGHQLLFRGHRPVRHRVASGTLWRFPLGVAGLELRIEHDATGQLHRRVHRRRWNLVIAAVVMIVFWIASRMARRAVLPRVRG